MREEIDGKFESILKEISFSKSVSTVTNSRSDNNDTVPIFNRPDRNV